MKSCSPLLMVCVLVGVCGSGCRDSGKRTDRYQLEAEAANLIQRGQEAEKTNYAEAVVFYQEALAKAASIVESNAATPLTRKAIEEATRIGPFTFSELRDYVLPSIRQKAEAEEHPLAGALLLAQTTKNPFQKTNLLSEIAQAYARMGQQEKVYEIVQHAGDANYGVLDAILQFYWSAELYAQAWEMTLKIEEEELGNWAAEWLALRYLNIGQPDVALRAVQEITDPDTKSDLLIKIAHVYIEDGQRALAVDWGEWRGVDQWTVPHSCRRAFFSPASKEKARAFLQLARNAAESIEEFTPQMERFVAIALGYSAAEDYAQAQQMTLRLRSADVKAKVLTSLAFRYAATGQRDASLAMLEQVEQLSKAVVDPSVRTALFTEAARVYVAAGEEQTALRLGESFRDPLARSEVLSVVVRKQAATGRHEEARRLASRIVEPGSRARAMRAVAQAYADAGEPEQAKQLATEANRDLPTIAHRYAVARQYEQARQVAEAIGDTAERVMALLDVALEQLNTLDVVAGAATLEHAMQTAAAILEPGERETTRIEMARTLLQAQQFSSARQVADSIGDREVRTSLLMDIACGLYAAGDEEQGALVLARGLLATRGLRDVHTRKQILANNVRQMVLLGRFAEALRIASWTADAESRAQLIAHVARGYLDVGRYDDAGRVAKTVADVLTRSQTLAVIVRKALSEDRDEFARQYAFIVPASAERERTLATLANWYVAHDRLDEALDIEAMIRTASLKTKLLREIALSYLVADQDDRALQLLARLSDPFARAELQATISRHYANTGRRTDALQLARTIKDMRVRERTIKTIVKTVGIDESDIPTAVALLTDQERFVQLKSVISEHGCHYAQPTVATLPRGLDRVSLLSLLARKCEEDGQREHATTLFAQAQNEVARIRDHADQSRARVGLVRQLTITGHLDAALSAAKQVENRNLRTDVLARIAYHDLENSNGDRAVTIAQALEDRERADRILTLLARKLFSMGQVDRATTIVGQMTNVSTQAKLSLEIAQAYAQDGRSEQANHFLARTQQLLGKLEASERANLLFALVREYLVNGIGAQALQVARSVTEVQARARLFSVIAKFEVSAGRVESALKLANEIEDPFVREEVLSEIIEQDINAGRYERAFLIAPTVTTSDTKMNLMIKIAQAELGELLAKEGREFSAIAMLTRQLDERTDVGLKADVVMPQLVRTYLEIGSDSRAMQMLPLLHASREKALLFAELAKIYAARGETNHVESMFTRAFQEACGLADEAEKGKAVTQVSILLASVSPEVSKTVLRGALRKIIEKIDNQKTEERAVRQNS